MERESLYKGDDADRAATCSIYGALKSGHWDGLDKCKRDQDIKWCMENIYIFQNQERI